MSIKLGTQNYISHDDKAYNNLNVSATSRIGMAMGRTIKQANSFPLKNTNIYLVVTQLNAFGI